MNLGIIITIVIMSIAALDHYYRRLNLTNQEFTGDERKEIALKRLKGYLKTLLRQMSRLKALPKNKKNGLIKNYLMIHLKIQKIIKVKFQMKNGQRY